MPAIVYLLCGLASFLCAYLLFRGFRASGTRLLFWGALCFACLVATNVLLFVDLILFPRTDLLVWRNVTTLLGLLLFNYGLIFDSHP